MTKREWTIGGITAVAVVVLVLLVQHIRDSRRDAQLVGDHQTIAADSAMRATAVATTIAAAAHLDTSTSAAARVDTVWRKVAARSLARIDTVILSNAMPDTMKIRVLAQDDSSLIVAGNALADTTQQLRAAAVNFQAKVLDERAAWTKERNAQANALAISESQHRHWGLGATAGYGVMRDNAGTLHTGPTLSIGVTYRW